jgi:DNA-binding Lrp family transcriptional regulator
MPAEEDRRILSELLKNSDRPQKSLSVSIGISESEFTRRKQNMLNLGIIQRYTITIDYEKLGYNSVGYYIFTVNDKTTIKTTDLVNFLKQIPEVIEINQVFGMGIDFIIKIMCKSNNQFYTVVGRISSHANVKSDSSFSAIVAEVSKNEPGAPIELA